MLSVTGSQEATLQASERSQAHLLSNAPALLTYYSVPFLLLSISLCISLVIASSALISTPFCSYSAVLFFLYYLLMHPNQLHTCELYLYVFVASSHVWFAER